MRDLHAQIRQEVAKKDMADNVKLGPGGIREIEFIAQVFQLIRGGRDPALQIKPTLQGAQAAGRARHPCRRGGANWPPPTTSCAASNTACNTSTTPRPTCCRPPRSPIDRHHRRAMGYGSYDGLLAELDDHRAAVARHFEAGVRRPQSRPHLAGLWRGAGDARPGRGVPSASAIADPAAAAQPQLAALREGPRYQQLPPASRALRCRCAAADQAAAEMPNPDADLRAASTCSTPSPPRRLPGPAAAVSAGAAQGGRAGRQPRAGPPSTCKRHPILLDELLDPRLLDVRTRLEPPSAPRWMRSSELEPDTERQMDLLREPTTPRSSACWRRTSPAVHGGDARRPPFRAGRHHARRCPAPRLLEEDQAPCRAPKFAVISYGKLGGKELGYASDLDLVFLYDDGAGAAENYTRLAQRLNTWLSAQTAAGSCSKPTCACGPTAIRPGGQLDGGLPQVPARIRLGLGTPGADPRPLLAGDPAVGEAFEKIRCEVLCQQRDLAKLRADIVHAQSA
jgi:glutamate-ammonia-ligase adenylyltransferase